MERVWVSGVSLGVGGDNGWMTMVVGSDLENDDDARRCGGGPTMVTRRCTLIGVLILPGLRYMYFGLVVVGFVGDAALGGIGASSGRDLVSGITTVRWLELGLMASGPGSGGLLGGGSSSMSTRVEQQ